MNTTKQIGKTLRNTRNEKHLSLQKASKLMRISPATLWKVETGKAKSISPKTKTAIESFVNSPREMRQTSTSSSPTTQKLATRGFGDLMLTIAELELSLIKIKEAITDIKF